MIEIHDESSIRAILRDPTFVPIDVAGTLSVLATATQCDFSSLSSRTSAIPFFAMGSRHRDLRLHLSGFFRPDILEPWRPTISVKAARLVAALSRKNGACLVDDFSFPLLLELAFDMLGIRPLERDIGLGFFHDLEALMEPLPSLAQIVRAQSALEQLSNHVLAFEPQQLTNGLKTLTEQLTKEQTVSNALTPTDIGTVVAICFMTTLATANMLSNILGDLLEAPEGLEQIAQRDLVKPNVDDMLRTSTVVTLILRRTTVGQKVGKHTLNAGDLVSLMIGDVNRDQSRCPAPLSHKRCPLFLT